MTKNLILIILNLLFFQTAGAQKKTTPDTTIYFRDQLGNPTDKEHVVDVIFIMPADSSSGKKLYPIKEYYLDGTLKLVGASNVLSSKPVLEGNVISYYANGNKKSIENYDDNNLTDSASYFYPNGKLSTIENYSNHRHLLITCKDSTGKVMTESGNGKWFENKYYDGWKITRQGTIKDSLKDGEWHETLNDTGKYITIYNKGVIVSSTDPFQVTDAPVFATVEQEPGFANGGSAGF